MHPANHTFRQSKAQQRVSNIFFLRAQRFRLFSYCLPAADTFVRLAQKDNSQRRPREGLKKSAVRGSSSQSITFAQTTLLISRCGQDDWFRQMRRTDVNCFQLAYGTPQSCMLFALRLNSPRTKRRTLLTASARGAKGCDFLRMRLQTTLRQHEIFLSCRSLCDFAFHIYEAHTHL